MTELVGPPVPDGRTPKRRRRLWLALAVVVLAGAGVTVFVLTRPAERPTDPHGIAEAVVAAMTQSPSAELRSYQCPPGPSDPPAGDPVYDAGSYTLGDELHLSGDFEIAKVADPNDPDVRYALYLVDYHGGWCLGGLAMCSRTKDGGYLVTGSLYCHEAYPEIPAY